MISWVSVPKNPLWDLVLASGKMKKYQIWGSVVLLLAFPVSYILLRMSYPASTVFYVLIVARFGHYLLSVYLVKPIAKYSVKEYFFTIYKPVAMVMIPSLILHYLLIDLILRNLYMTISFILISIVLNLLLIYVLGISNEERKIVLSIIKKNIGK